MINYIEKNLFDGIKKEDNIFLIPHITNNVKGWGAGFVVPLGNCFPKAKQMFLSFDNPKLGDVQFCECDNKIICNMFAQDGIRNINNLNPIRYESLKQCMNKIKKYIEDLMKSTNKKIVISAPMFGSGLAGGEWSEIENMINEIWKDFDVDIYFFEKNLPKGYFKENNLIKKKELNVL